MSKLRAMVANSIWGDPLAAGSIHRRRSFGAFLRTPPLRNPSIGEFGFVWTTCWTAAT